MRTPYCYVNYYTRWENFKYTSNTYQKTICNLT